MPLCNTVMSSSARSGWKSKRTCSKKGKSKKLSACSKKATEAVKKRKRPGRMWCAIMKTTKPACTTSTICNKVISSVRVPLNLPTVTWCNKGSNFPGNDGLSKVHNKSSTFGPVKNPTNGTSSPN